ncbi:MAG TPA: hypothetical protein VNE38_04820 [Ktedonobacteraceae bacterium]|nr:hypothetical protein [Ktedonobacteraceae bacterium]
MHQRKLFYCSILCLIVLSLLLAACGPFGGNATTTPTPTKVPNAGTTSTGTTIDQLTQAVLQNMHLHSWNTLAMSKNVVTGGLYINWKMNDPSVTNAVRPGPDGNPQHNHDPQVDLFYLTSLVEYHQLHPQDQSFASDLARMTTVVVSEYPSYSVPKGWIYFYLLNDGLLLQNSDLVNEAYTAANNFYRTWYDKKLGVVYDIKHTPGDYGVDHSMMAGAALIDAGKRWNVPAWVTAGKSTIDTILAVALDPKYHMFYDSMVVNADGHETVQNYQAKPSTQGQTVDALVIAYTLTHKTNYLNVAREVLQNLYSSGLWDSKNGGFFFALDMKSGKLLTDYKETRSQTLVLLALQHFNQVKPQFTQQEQQLTSVIANHFYQSTYHGFFYRVTPTFQVYYSRPGTGIGVEDYFTTEAMGSALDALQTTELK